MSFDSQHSGASAAFCQWHNDLKHLKVAIVLSHSPLLLLMIPSLLAAACTLVTEFLFCEAIVIFSLFIVFTILCKTAVFFYNKQELKVPFMSFLINVASVFVNGCDTTGDVVTSHE